MGRSVGAGDKFGGGGERENAQVVGAAGAKPVRRAEQWEGDEEEGRLLMAARRQLAGWTAQGAGWPVGPTGRQAERHATLPTEVDRVVQQVAGAARPGAQFYRRPSVLVSELRAARITSKRSDDESRPGTVISSIAIESQPVVSSFGLLARRPLGAGCAESEHSPVARFIWLAPRPTAPSEQPSRPLEPDKIAVKAAARFNRKPPSGHSPRVPTTATTSLGAINHVRPAHKRRVGEVARAAGGWRWPQFRESQV